MVWLIPARAGNTHQWRSARLRIRAHPRSRGEHVPNTATGLRLPGSSPLARGTPGVFYPDRPLEGLIPARAGNTLGLKNTDYGDGAHPRSRGEHLDLIFLALTLWGSSPLARGTHVLMNDKVARVGLIPARAGNTRRHQSRRYGRGAHPRSRGEHKSTWTAWSAPTGSSPLARGTPSPGHGRDLDAGLIPARAGNTHYYRRFGNGSRAHPRSRGEHSPPRSNGIGVEGSSPLARGTRNLSRRVRLSWGLIPARAGNTYRRNNSELSNWAHPRSRGEHFRDCQGAVWDRGSSPLARGTRRCWWEWGRSPGLIPARAGNTDRLGPAKQPDRAHPRSRGEHLAPIVAFLIQTGSSPLARGTLQTRKEVFHDRGLIPARAGNTIFSRVFAVLTWAHPRSRGEHLPGCCPRGSRPGSSPLARGTLVFSSFLNAGLGLIPARAGNPERGPEPLCPVGAHPRSRGEHEQAIVAGDIVVGSSPLARGTHAVLNPGEHPGGLIPARAGNTHFRSLRIRRHRAHPRSRGEHTC